MSIYFHQAGISLLARELLNSYIRLIDAETLLASDLKVKLERRRQWDMVKQGQEFVHVLGSLCI
jgi:hypothetical protein